MEDDVRDEDALAAAGYTGRRGAILFSALLGVIGALLGSVLIAILWNMAVPARQDLGTLVGIATGGMLGVLIGLVKVRRGNREALEEVEDRAWRRNMMRHLGR